MRLFLISVFVLICVPPVCADEPVHRLRLATVAPDGTSWAREFRAFARDVELQTEGRVQIKWYFGGIAGDELQVLDRIHRGQLDGIASPAMLCQRLAPTTRVMAVPGLFKDRTEALHIYARLTPQLNDEFAAAGFAYLGGPQLGPDIFLTRRPVRTIDDLRKLKLWVWDLDQSVLAAAQSMKLNDVALPIDKALAAYDEVRVDGFVTIPTAALAFQWSTRARYLTPLPMIYLSGCFIARTTALDELSHEDQQTVRAAAAKAIARVSEVGGLIDDQLIGSLFAKQGLEVIPVSAELSKMFAVAAKEARIRLSKDLVPGLLDRVESFLSEYRAHSSH